jgi:acetyltransferase-like isoleucine patch superfamily enzyme
MVWDTLIEQARQGKGPLRHARKLRNMVRRFRLPVVRPVVGVFYVAAKVTRTVCLWLVKIIVREPYVRYRCAKVGKRLVLEGASPQIFGTGRIELGDDVHIGASCTWDLAYDVAGQPKLIVGSHVSINYRNMMSIAKSITIGDYTMIAGNVNLFDNISHPISPARRQAHLPITAEDASPIVIGKNCWIGLNSIILKGVTIGDNSIVAAGSVVTKPVPANTIVAGNPAVPVKSLPNDIGDPENARS